MFSIVDIFLRSATRPLIVLLGPTAAGKTACSIALAQHINKQISAASASTSSGSFLEILNADSRQLYRGLNIGTAKITAKEMLGVPHHLLDVLDPNEEITAATYQHMALPIINAIHRRGRVPMLVGGSMLYISAIIDGLDFPPAADQKRRHELEKEYEADGGVALHARLAGMDSAAAAAIPRQNKPYLIRAFERIHSTGKAAPVQTSGVPYDMLILGIDRPRDELTTRINHRTAALLENGWIEEVESLLAAGYDASAPAMKSHGYKEIMEWIARGENAAELATLTEEIAAKTRQYAKRQRTWWKGDRRIQWISADDLLASHPSSP